MKTFILVVLAVFMAVDPATVKKINETKEAAAEAFKAGNYKEAIRHYKTLVDSLGVNDDAVVLNLANAYYLARDTANAFNNYQAVAESAQPEISSKAHQQLGVMLNKRGKAEDALKQFKAAIKAEPGNDDARYNYEMVKKKLEEQKKQQQQQQNKDQKNDQQNKDQQKEEQKKNQENKDQENKDEQNKDQQQKEQEQKEKEQKEQQQKEQQEKEKQEQQQKDAKKEEMPNLDKEKLENMKISEEKARMILEAMKNQERQYLQQQRRKATQPKDPNQPDW